MLGFLICGVKCFCKWIIVGLSSYINNITKLKNNEFQIKYHLKYFKKWNSAKIRSLPISYYVLAKTISKTNNICLQKKYQFSQKTKSHIAEILVIAWYYKILLLCLFEIKKFKTGRTFNWSSETKHWKKNFDCSLEVTF